MTLGTAASSSTTNPSGFPIFAGASVTNIAIPMLSGTPIAIANAEVTNVPTMYGRTPNDSRPSTGFQSVPVTNPSPSSAHIGYDSKESWNTINTMMTRT